MADTEAWPGKGLIVTVRDSLAHSPIDFQRASEALAGALPVGRAVTITPEILKAAAAGDLGLLATLLAEEVEPDEVDLALLRDIDDDHEGAISGDELRRELGIPLS